VLRKQASPDDSPLPLLGTRQTDRDPASVNVADNASVDRTIPSRPNARTFPAGLSTAGDRQPRAKASAELTLQTVEGGWEHRPATCLQPAPPPEPQPRTSPPCQVHRIVDGDDLPSLAERYLGDSKRYLEIFHANRHVLSRPDLLPLGIDLRIPN
jgi:nucleoid-associated protein YgaU